MSYAEFLASKRLSDAPSGMDVAAESISTELFDFQREIVQWALMRGRAAIFADTGLGKTAMQLEWARHVGDVLILAPLAVGTQTAAEGEKFGVPVTVCRDGSEVRPGVNVTNYERLNRFDPGRFAGVVLDESSILKAFDGKTRRALTDFGSAIPYRLCCTATPAPNDLEELGSHAEFLSVMSRKELVALFFTQDGNTSTRFRLKGHARRDFWKWLASWSVAVRTPADLGYDASRFVLPPLNMHEEIVGVQDDSLSTLFAVEAQSLSERQTARRDSLAERVAKVVERVNLSHKLAACGSPNTRTGAASDTPTMSPSASDASLNRGRRKTTANTSAPITSDPRSSSEPPNAEQPRANSATQLDESDTPTTPSTASSVESFRGHGTRKHAENPDSASSSGSEQPTTTGCSLIRVEDARSAAPSTVTPGGTDSTSITAMSQGASGGFSVPSATLLSASSKTTPNDSDEPSPTSGLEPWVIWCGLNAEQDAVAAALGDRCFSVYGSLPAEEKQRRLFGWLNGERPVLVSKPSIAGFGINAQHCARVAFVGLSDSFEQFYQAVRRCWRFGQTRPVECYVVAAETEGAVVRNIKRKEAQASMMLNEIAKNVGGRGLEQSRREEQAHERDWREGDGWTMHLGDSVEVIEDVEPDSAGLVLFSPPFPGMYAYTNSPRDMGNVRGMEEMIDQFSYLLPGLLRATMPGRSCAVHLTQGVTFKGQEGHSGLKDFRGRVIEAMESAGWIYYGEVCIDKNPQVKAIRTKDRGLLFKTLANDASHMHMALADYLLQFRKPGDNAAPIRAGVSEKYGNEDGWISQEEWIEWAAPVWYRADAGIPGGIRETDVLNVSQARETDDERHLAPLQLGVIERAVKLWTNPGETVLSPFGGIGSEGVGALRHGRRYVGIELKRSYFEQACRNLAVAAPQASLLEAAV